MSHHTKQSHLRYRPCRYSLPDLENHVDLLNPYPGAEKWTVNVMVTFFPAGTMEGSTEQDSITTGGGCVLVGGWTLVGVGGIGVRVGGAGVKVRVNVGRGVLVGMNGVSVSVGVGLGISVEVGEDVNVGLGVSVGWGV